MHHLSEKAKGQLKGLFAKYATWRQNIAETVAP